MFDFFNDFKIYNKVRLLYKIFIIIFSICSFTLINIFSFKHYKRISCANSALSPISEYAIQALSSLKSTLEIFVVYSVDSESNETPFFIEDVRRLVMEYSNYNPSQIKFQLIEFSHQASLVDVLSKQFGNIETNSIILSYNNKSKVFPIFNLYQFDDGNASKFIGDSILSKEINTITSEKEYKIGFTTGHGEMRIDSVHPFSGISSCAESLRQQGFSLSKIKLQEEDIADYEILMIVGPISNFSDNEHDKIQNYLLQGGKCVIFLTPTKSCNLEELFYQWGILADDMIIINKKTDHLSISGDNLIDIFGDHSITESNVKMNVNLLLGMAQPIRPDLGYHNDGNIKLFPLFFSGKETFATFDYARNNVEFNKNLDIAGPLPIAILAEKHQDHCHNIKKLGQLIVIGNENFINNNRFNLVGNRIFFNSMVQYLIKDEDKANNFIGSAITHDLPKKFILTKKELLNVFLCIVSISGIWLLLAFIVYFIRRK